MGHDVHVGGAIVGLVTATLLGLSFLIPFLLVKDPWHLLERKLEYGNEAPAVG